MPAVAAELERVRRRLVDWAAAGPVLLETVLLQLMALPTLAVVVVVELALLMVTGRREMVAPAS